MVSEWVFPNCQQLLLLLVWLLSWDLNFSICDDLQFMHQVKPNTPFRNLRAACWNLNELLGIIPILMRWREPLSEPTPKWRENTCTWGERVQNGTIIIALCLDGWKILVRTQMVALDGWLLLAWYKSSRHLEQSIDSRLKTGTHPASVTYLVPPDDLTLRRCDVYLKNGYYIKQVGNMMAQWKMFSCQNIDWLKTVIQTLLVLINERQ